MTTFRQSHFVIMLILFGFWSMFFLSLSNAVFAQESQPTFEKPDSIQDQTDSEILIKGSNFITPALVTLDAIPLNTTVVSTTLISATVPITQTAGTYELCVSVTNISRCWDYQIEQFVIIELANINRKEVYLGTLDTSVVLSIYGIERSISDIQSNTDQVYLGNTKLDITDYNFYYEGGKVGEEVVVNIPESIPNGTYTLTIKLAEGQTITSVLQIFNAQQTIQPTNNFGWLRFLFIAIFPALSTIILHYNHRSQDEQTKLNQTVPQLNRLVSFLIIPIGIGLFGLFLYLPSSDITDSIIMFIIPLGVTVIVWNFLQSDSSEKTGIIERITAVFIAVMVCGFVFVLSIALTSTWGPSESLLLKTIYLGVSLGLLMAGLASLWKRILPFSSPTLMGFLVISAVVLLSQGDVLPWTTLATSTLIGFNIALIFAISNLLTYFHQEAVSNLVRYSFRVTMFIITCGLLFLSPQLTANYILLGELIIAFVIIGFGVWGLQQAGKKLEAKKNEITDEIVDLRISQALYEDGVVFFDKLEDIPQKHALTRMEHYFTENSKQQGLDFSRATGQLSFKRRGSIKRISEKFRAVQENPLSNKYIEDCLKALYESLNFTISKKKLDKTLSPEKTPYLHLFSISSERLQSVLPDPFPLILHTNSEPIRQDELQAIKQQINKLDTKKRFGVFIAVNEPTQTKTHVKTEIVGTNQDEKLVVFNEQDIKEILASGKTDIREAFMDALDQQIDLLGFSPYRAESVTPLDMFYGRTRELNNATTHIQEGSATLIGTRRMGKTSLLDQIGVNLERKNYIVFNLNCNVVTTYEQFFSEIANQIAYQITKKSWRVEDIDFSIYQKPQDFSQLVVDLQALCPNQLIVFTWDEIDRLLKYDIERKEELFRGLRALAQQKRCQFVFSGERFVLEQMSNPESSMYNFTKKVPINLLDKVASSDLVTIPMRLIGIELEDSDAIANLVYQYTSGHPHLIQYLCHQCVEALKSQKSNRILNIKVVQDEVNHIEYKDHYIKTFQSQGISEFERAIAMCIAHHEKISEVDLFDELEGLGFDFVYEELKAGLRYLMLGHLAVSKDNLYSIQPMKYAEFLFSTLPYNKRIRDLRKTSKQKKDT